MIPTCKTRLRVAHVLRKYEPLEWGGTETAILRLVEGLASMGVDSCVHCPQQVGPSANDPLREAGIKVRRFSSFMPVLGISKAQRRQLVRWGGNLMSFELLGQLFEGNYDLIHTHALNRLAGVAMLAARRRRIPLVVTVHGGALDLPAHVEAELTAPLRGGFEWGKLLGLFLQSRRVLEKADAILACNPREAELLRQTYPSQRVVLQPHSVAAGHYTVDRRNAARAAFPQIIGREVLLCVARMDPVKNQLWLVRQMDAVRQRRPAALLVLAGPATNEAYATEIQAAIGNLGLENHVLCTGGLEPGSAPLIGLMQQASAMLLPSHSETFGLAILEAWAAGTPVVSSRTSGACSLVLDRENGFLHNIDSSEQFHCALQEALTKSPALKRIINAGESVVRTRYDSHVMAAQVVSLYEELQSAQERRKAA